MKPQHIIGLQAENVKRLTAVKIELPPAPGTVIIAGENAAGKSSVLDAICAAIGGGDWAIPEPIRKGAERALVVLTTEDLVVTRRFTAENTYLDVSNRDGLPYKSPQSLLDSLVAKVALDPVKFADMPAKQQASVLLKLCPLDLNIEDPGTAYPRLYEERALSNRVLAQREAVLAQTPPVEAPPVEVSVQTLLERASVLRGEQSVQQGKAAEAQTAQAEMQTAQADVAKTKEALQLAEARLAQRTANYEACVQALAAVPNVDAEVAAAHEAVAAAERTNALARKAQERAALEAQVLAGRATVEKLENALRRNLAERADAFKHAKFPVSDLSVDDAGQLTYKGVLLCQASRAEQIKVGLALAAACNPTLKVCFIRDGSLLDAQSMATVEEVAKAHNLQVWLERVGDDGPAAIQIVEGTNIVTLQDAPAAAPAETVVPADAPVALPIPAPPPPAFPMSLRERAEATTTAPMPAADLTPRNFPVPTKRRPGRPRKDSASQLFAKEE